MIRISKLADYAVVVLVHLLGMGDVRTCPAIAKATGIPEPTVGKVLKLLAAGGVVASQRGARGGYRLARPADAISIATVIAVMDGPIALTECAEGGRDCVCHDACPARGGWDTMNGAIRDVFAAVTIEDMRARSVGVRDADPPVAPAPTMREKSDAGGC